MPKQKRKFEAAEPVAVVELEDFAFEAVAALPRIVVETDFLVANKSNEEVAQELRHNFGLEEVHLLLDAAEIALASVPVLCSAEGIPSSAAAEVHNSETD